MELLTSSAGTFILMTDKFFFSFGYWFLGWQPNELNLHVTSFVIVRKYKNWNAIMNVVYLSDVEWAPVPTEWTLCSLLYFVM